jgi:hypothetical protein
MELATQFTQGFAGMAGLQCVATQMATDPSAISDSALFERDVARERALAVSIFAIFSFRFPVASLGIAAAAALMEVIAAATPGNRAEARLSAAKITSGISLALAFTTIQAGRAMTGQQEANTPHNA